MGCSLNYDIISQYPEQLLGIFFSSGQDYTTVTETDNFDYIANNELGYLIELDRLGQSSDAPGSPDNRRPANDPYSTYLRPVSDISQVYNAQKVLVEKVEFYGYDLNNENSEVQDSEVLTTIFDSRTANNAYAQSTMFNSILPTSWQPNYFRPSLRINGRELFQGIQSSYFSPKNNEGDLSIGLPLPYCAEVYREFGKIQKNGIQAFAQIAQPVKVPDVSDYRFQRYGVLMIVTFRIGTGTAEVKNG